MNSNNLWMDVPVEPIYSQGAGKVFFDALDRQVSLDGSGEWFLVEETE